MTPEEGEGGPALINAEVGRPRILLGVRGKKKFQAIEFWVNNAVKPEESNGKRIFPPNRLLRIPHSGTARTSLDFLLQHLQTVVLKRPANAGEGMTFFVVVD
jgi:hypothetical protein